MIKLSTLILENDLKAEAEQLQRNLLSRYPLADLHLYIASDKSLYIGSIRAKNPGQGVGSKVMAEIKAFADKHGLTITLSPEADPRKKAKLSKFYRNMGFIPNRGRHADYRLGGAFGLTMYRRPGVNENEKEELFRVGQSPDEESSDTPINWKKDDIQMNAVWSEEVVRKFLGLPDTFEAIYPAIIEVNELDYKLAEEDPELDPEEQGGYDWDEFRMFGRRGVPPVVIIREENGKLVTADGNHRIKWAYDVGYSTIGAWVADKLLQKAIDNGKA